MDSKSEELCLGDISCWLEPELPDDLRILGVPERLGGFWREPGLAEVDGRGGEWLPWLGRDETAPSEEPPLANMYEPPSDDLRVATSGVAGIEVDGRVK